MFRSLGALIGDLLVVILFAAVGMIQHGTPLTSENLILVGWPFVAGLLLGHLAIRSWRAPFSLWPHGIFVWAITVAATMALRTLLSQGAETSFVIVTAVVTGVLMLGWRALAMYLTRGERPAAAARAATVATGGAGTAVATGEAGTPADDQSASDPTEPSASSEPSTASDSSPRSEP